MIAGPVGPTTTTDGGVTTITGYDYAKAADDAKTEVTVTQKTIAPDAKSVTIGFSANITGTATATFASGKVEVPINGSSVTLTGEGITTTDKVTITLSSESSKGYKLKGSTDGSTLEISLAQQ